MIPDTDRRDPDPVSRRNFLRTGIGVGGVTLAGLADRGAAAGAGEKPAAAKKSAIVAGFGVADITPAVGMQMPGGFFRRTGKGVRDKLLAVACVVRDGPTPVALVGVDALFVGKDTVQAARRMIQGSTDIKGEHVLVGANHTHSGGPVMSCLGSDEDPVYTDRLVRAIAAAVGDAWRGLKPVDIGIGTGKAEGIAFNRRFLMRDGREITHPGKPGTPHHAEIVAPAGPTDPDVGVLAARNEKGAVIGVVVHFACHSTVVGGDLFSPDYAGYLRKHLKGRYGEQTPVAFLLGPCGDVTQVDNMSTAVEFGPDHADMMGMTLASETVRTIGRMKWLTGAPTAAAVEAAAVAVRQDPDPDRERPAFGLGSGPAVEPVYATERQLVAAERKASPVLASEVQGIRVGPLGIAANGAEYFCEYGLRIKRCSPFDHTWVVSLANEYIGYVPTPQAFAAGGYEPRTARSSKLAPDAGQRLAEAGLTALGRVAGK